MLKTFALGLTFIILFQVGVASHSLAQGYEIPPSTGLPSESTRGGGSR